MSFGIQTVLTHLDTMNWPNFSAWNNNQYPSFAGRNFVYGDFSWGRAEGSSMPNGPAGAVTRILPIQAVLATRQSATGIDGFLNGTQDGTDVCKKLFNLIITGETKLTVNALANVYLDVQTGTVVSADYWAAWAAALKAFIATDLIPTLPPQPAGQQIAGAAYTPFMPCICCDFALDGNGNFQPDPNVVACLTGAATRFPKVDARCWGFWAKTPADPALRVPAPALDWTKFPDFKQPMGDPAKGFTVPVPILLRRYADYDPADNAFAGGEPVSCDASDGSKWGDAYGLTIQVWQLPDTPAARLNWGFDTDRVNISRATAVAISNQTVDGNPLRYLGSYYRAAGNVNQIGSGALANLGAAGVDFFAVFQGGAATHTKAYYTLAQGQADGQAAFNAALGVGQPANTPIYFAVDEDPNIDPSGTAFDPENVPADASTIDDYFGGIRQSYQTYLTANAPDPTPYCISVYAGKVNAGVLSYCYRKGYASYFWFARYITLANQNVNNNRPWRHSNMWQYDDTGQLTPTLAAGTADKNTSWGDEGSWTP